MDIYLCIYSKSSLCVGVSFQEPLWTTNSMDIQTPRIQGAILTLQIQLGLCASQVWRVYWNLQRPCTTTRSLCVPQRGDLGQKCLFWFNSCISGELQLSQPAMCPFLSIRYAFIVQWPNSSGIRILFCSTLFLSCPFFFSKCIAFMGDLESLWCPSVII